MTQTTIVLGCSRAKRALLVPVLETLAGRGNTVEIVSSLDDRDEPWTDAIGRLGNTAVYLLCSDETLNLRRVSELRRLLSDGSVAASRCWCGPVDWSDPSQLFRTVEHLLAARTVVQSPAMETTPGPSETSGTVIAPSMSNGAAPSAGLQGSDPSDTFVAPLVPQRKWKPVAAIGGAALMLLSAVAIPMLVGDDAAASENEVVAANDASSQAPLPAPVAADPEPAAREVDGANEAEGTDEDRDAVFAALANQSVRALDILLIGPEAKKLSKRGNEITARMPFDDALAYCQNLDVDGLRQWRLPTAGELASLSDNKMLGKGVYWSATEGDSFGNDRIVWSVRKKRMKPMSRGYTGARTVCVRRIARQ